jgi:hypothetical protein
MFAPLTGLLLAPEGGFYRTQQTSAPIRSYSSLCASKYMSGPQREREKNRNKQRKKEKERKREREREKEKEKEQKNKEK